MFVTVSDVLSQKININDTGFKIETSFDKTSYVPNQYSEEYLIKNVKHLIYIHQPLYSSYAFVWFFSPFSLHQDLVEIPLVDFKEFYDSIHVIFYILRVNLELLLTMTTIQILVTYFKRM